MKKIFILLPVLIIVLFSACKKDKEVPKPDNQDIIKQLFEATMGGVGSMKDAKSTQPINFQVDYTMNGSLGGTIHVTGSITGNVTINDETFAFEGETINLGFSETLSDFVIESEGKNYTLNGAPYLTLTGLFTYNSDMTFGTASSMHYAGGIRITGDGYDQTVNMDINIILNSNGTGGTVSGYVDGEPINYTF